MQNLLKTVTIYRSLISEKAGSKVDEVMLAKAVLTSQPPRPQDVPDLVAYVLKWGGSPHGRFIASLCEEFKLRVPSERVVSGSVFRKLADLKFPPTEAPVHFVSAALITHAEAEEGVQDGCFARYITLGEFDAMAAKKNRVLVLECEGYLKRGDALVQKMRSTRTQAVMIGAHMDFKVNIIRHFLKRKATVEKFPTLENILHHFAKELDTKEEDEAAADDIEKLDPKQKHNVVTYNEDGDIEGLSTMTMQNMGFKDGTFVHKNKETQLMQWQISQLGVDGQVQLARVQLDGSIDDDETGSVVTVCIDTFCATYKTCEKIKLVPKFEDKSLTSEHKDIKAMKYRSYVITCLEELHSKFPTDPTSFMPLEQPVRTVIAKRAFNPGDLVVIPITTSFSVKDPTTTYSNKCAEATIAGEGAPTFVLGPPGGKDELSVFFMFRIVHVETEANLKFSTHEISFKHPQFGSKPAKNVLTEISFTSIVNSKTIKINDELLLFRPRVEKPQEKKRVISSVSNDRPAKKKA